MRPRYRKAIPVPEGFCEPVHRPIERSSGAAVSIHGPTTALKIWKLTFNLMVSPFFKKCGGITTIIRDGA